MLRNVVTYLLMTAMTACPFSCMSGATFGCADLVTAAASETSAYRGCACCRLPEPQQSEQPENEEPANDEPANEEPCQGVCGGAVAEKAVEFDIEADALVVIVEPASPSTSMARVRLCAFDPAVCLLSGRVLRTRFMSYLC